MDMDIYKTKSSINYKFRCFPRQRAFRFLTDIFFNVSLKLRIALFVLFQYVIYSF